jgi:hypothetical protein
MRRRPKSSSSPAARTRKPAVDAATAAAPKRAQPPLVEQFHVAVDRQLKSGHATYEAAEKAALAIKKRYPLLQVSVYDAKEQRHIAIQAPQAAADPQKKDARAPQRSNSKRRAVAGARR